MTAHDGVLRTLDGFWSQYRRQCEGIERAAGEAIFMEDPEAGVAHIETALHDLREVVELYLAEGGTDA